MERKQQKASRQALDHAQRARAALDEFANDGISAEGELTRVRTSKEPR